MSEGNYGHPYLIFKMATVGEATPASTEGPRGKPHGDPKCGCGPCIDWALDRWAEQKCGRGRP
jgi:hypothetical protein